MPQCKNCGNQYIIEEEDIKFLEKVSPQFDGEIYTIPAPDECPDCRLTKRFTFRNTRSLYRRKCDFTGKEMISQYHENHPFPVYNNDIWWSDKWDAIEYGMEFDFNRPFFDQLKDLKNKVPHSNLFIINGTLENSDYTNCTGYLKNCYLIFESDYNEDCYYSNLIKQSKNLVDCSICFECELCYECIDCIKCFNLQHSQDCSNCSDSYFLKYCNGCKDCIGCINQRHKQYMIFNKQYSKEEYEKLKAEMKLNTTEGIKELTKMALEFYAKQPQKVFIGENNENSIGNHLYNTKNAKYCFDSKDIEDCSYCSKLIMNIKDCMDYSSWGHNAELIYYSSACGSHIQKSAFCITSQMNLNNAYYADQCVSCSDIFGCISLNKKKYCILNKQYTKEKYEEIVPKIIEHMKKSGEWGKFFPKDYNPFGYNESIALENFPKTKHQAISEGYKWNEYEQEQPKTVEILNSAIKCEVSGKLFKMTDQELAFYKRMDIPLPTKHYDVRHQQRMARRLSLTLFDSNCDKCKAEIKSPFEKDRQEKVYCEKCYLKEIV